MNRGFVSAVLRSSYALFATAIAACAGGGAASGGAGAAPRAAGTGLRIEDRVVVPSMSIVRGLAVSDRYLFIATPEALGVYDRQFGEWRPPLTPIDGWPASPVTVIMADPADPTAVWFGAENFVFHYRAGFGDVVRAAVPGPVSAASFFVDGADPAAGVVVGGGAGGAVRVSPTGFVQQYNPASAGRGGAGARVRIVPQTVAAVYAQFHTLQNFELTLTRDDALRTWPVLSAGVSPTRSEVWLGTAGGGVFKVDPVFAKGEQIPFGLIGEGAGAVASAGDGVWIGSLRAGVNQRSGLTFADNELRHWRWADGGLSSPFTSALITSISVLQSAVWAGTDRGVVHLDAQSGNVIRRWDDATGLPAAQVLAVSATGGGAWVGTVRGLAFVNDRGASAAGARPQDVDASFMTGIAVRALVRRGDTLWIGSDVGVFALPPATAQPRRIRAAATDTRLTQTITAIASADSIVVVATANGDILRLHAGSGDLLDPVSYVSALRAGRVYALAMDASTLWIAGEAGVIIVRRDNGTQRFLGSGVDIPGEVFGVALTREYAWLATRQGAVRLRRFDDGTVR